MDLKLMLTTFGLVFLAELGDKTQIATFCFAAECKGGSRLSVFLGSAGALVTTSLIAVLFGAVAGKYIPGNYVKIGAGALFVALGLWMLLSTSSS
jgi:putative Ca2+/H+ antiporter (TMEM165/GDT1 family)